MAVLITVPLGLALSQELSMEQSLRGLEIPNIKLFTLAEIHERSRPTYTSPVTPVIRMFE